MHGNKNAKLIVSMAHHERENQTACRCAAEDRVHMGEEHLICLWAELVAANRDYQDMECSIDILKTLFIQANTDPWGGHTQSLDVSEQMPPMSIPIWWCEGQCHSCFIIVNLTAATVQVHLLLLTQDDPFFYFYGPWSLSHILSCKYFYCSQSVKSIIHSWFSKAPQVRIKPQPHFTNRLSKVEAVIPKVSSCSRTFARAL